MAPVVGKSDQFPISRGTKDLHSHNGMGVLPDVGPQELEN